MLVRVALLSTAHADCPLLHVYSLYKSKAQGLSEERRRTELLNGVVRCYMTLL